MEQAITGKRSDEIQSSETPADEPTVKQGEAESYVEQHGKQEVLVGALKTWKMSTLSIKFVSLHQTPSPSLAPLHQLHFILAGVRLPPEIFRRLAIHRVCLGLFKHVSGRSLAGSFISAM